MRPGSVEWRETSLSFSSLGSSLLMESTADALSGRVAVTPISDSFLPRTNGCPTDGRSHGVCQETVVSQRVNGRSGLQLRQHRYLIWRFYVSKQDALCASVVVHGG